MECGFELSGRGVSGKGLDRASWRGLFEVGTDGGEAFRSAGEEGYSEVSMLGVRENACYAGALALSAHVLRTGRAARE